MAIDYSAFSRDQNTAMSQFRAQYGRAPTSAEISGWQSYGAPAASPSSSQPVLPQSTSNVQSGFGGQKQWDVLQQLALGPSDVSTLPGMELLDSSQFDTTTAKTEEALGSVSSSIEKLSAANASMLKGEIPADLSAAVRRAASETSIKGGVFGSASRAMSARDLGRTSYDVKQQGIANEQNLVEAKNTYAAARESIRQFNANRNAAITKLSMDARNQNLQAIDVERQRIATNIEANVNIMQSIANMVMAQQQTAASAAANKIDPTNMIAAIDNMIEQFSGRLS